MGVYTEHNVKQKAITIFLNLVVRKNVSLGTKLNKYREAIYPVAIAGIQRIGIHDYTDKVLKFNSDERAELNDAIERERTYVGV